MTTVVDPFGNGFASVGAVRGRRLRLVVGTFRTARGRARVRLIIEMDGRTHRPRIDLPPDLLEEALPLVQDALARAHEIDAEDGEEGDWQ